MKRVILWCLLMGFYYDSNSKDSFALKAPPGYYKKIIDAHAHLACVNYEGCYLAPKYRDSYKFKLSMKAVEITEDDLNQPDADQMMVDNLLRRLKESEFYSGAIVYALDGFYDENKKLDLEKTDLLIPNDYVAMVAKNNPNLYFGASINPNRNDALEVLKKAKEDGAKLVKWIPCTMGINLKNPNRDTLDFLKKMKEYDLPLVTHVGFERTFSWSDDELCNPKYIENILKMGVRVVAAHAGISGDYDNEKAFKRLFELSEKYKNLYVDNSAGLFFVRFGIYKEVFSEHFNGKIIQGTDYPLNYVSFWGFQSLYLWQFKSDMTPFWYEYAKRTKNIHDLEAAIKFGMGST